jgi:hypothetical protein
MQLSGQCGLILAPTFPHYYVQSPRRQTQPSVLLPLQPTTLVSNVSHAPVDPFRLSILPDHYDRQFPPKPGSDIAMNLPSIPEYTGNSS